MLNLNGIEQLFFKYTPLKDADGKYTVSLVDELKAENILKILYPDRLPQAENILIDPQDWIKEENGDELIPIQSPQGCALLRKGDDLWIGTPKKGALAFVGAFGLTEAPSADVSAHKDKIPLLTLVDAYVEMAGDPIRDNGYDFYQEIPLQDVVNYISSPKRDFKVQIPGDEEVARTDKYGRVFLSDRGLVTRSDMTINSSDGDIQQEFDKKNLYLKEARGFRKARLIFKNIDKIEKDTR